MRIFKLFFSLGMALHLFACSFWRIKNESSSPVRVRRRVCVCVCVWVLSVCQFVVLSAGR